MTHTCSSGQRWRTKRCPWGKRQESEDQQLQENNIIIYNGND